MSAQTINFVQEIAKMKHQPMVDKSSGIAIWGGELSEELLGQFLDAWNWADMPYRIWQYTDRCDFVSKQLPASERYFLLEHGRLFGPGGDLELRRDGNRFLWHFIGKDSISRPGSFSILEYWQCYPQQQLRVQEGTALLWGEYQTDMDCWREDRVAHRALHYPVLAPAQREREQVVYSAFYDGGQVAFVWWKELKKYEGQD